MRIIVNGQQAFGARVLNALLERGEDIVGVYTRPEKPGRRPDPLADAAREHGLPLFQPSSFKNEDTWAQMKSLRPDLGVMAYVTLFVPEQALDIPTHGTIQYHPSLLPLHRGPSSINWPIIVLLGAMIPVGGALESTGGAARIASLVTDLGHTLPPWTILAIVLVTTMLLSDVVNNSTAVILMAPVAMGVAQTMGASVDPFLMAVAIGGSSAFLTPIGHQSNTIVMGPGGYKFGDYWRMGLPLDVIIVSVSVPLLAWIWPLNL